jgi:hypothetical protein
MIDPHKFKCKPIPDARLQAGLVKVLDWDNTFTGRTSYVFLHYGQRAGEVMFVGNRVNDPILGQPCCGLAAATAASEVMDTNYDLCSAICSQFRIQASTVAIGATGLNGTLTAGRIPSVFTPFALDPQSVTSFDQQTQVSMRQAAEGCVLTSTPVGVPSYESPHYAPTFLLDTNDNNQVFTYTYGGANANSPTFTSAFPITTGNAVWLTTRPGDSAVNANYPGHLGRVDVDIDVCLQYAAPAGTAMTFFASTVTETGAEVTIFQENILARPGVTANSYNFMRRLSFFARRPVYRITLFTYDPSNVTNIYNSYVKVTNYATYQRLVPANLLYVQNCDIGQVITMSGKQQLMAKPTLSLSREISQRADTASAHEWQAWLASCEMASSLDLSGAFTFADHQKIVDRILRHPYTLRVTDSDYHIGKASILGDIWSGIKSGAKVLAPFASEAANALGPIAARHAWNIGKGLLGSASGDKCIKTGRASGRPPNRNDSYVGKPFNQVAPEDFQTICAEAKESGAYPAKVYYQQTEWLIIDRSKANAAQLEALTPFVDYPPEPKNARAPHQGRAAGPERIVDVPQVCSLGHPFTRVYKDVIFRRQQYKARVCLKMDARDASLRLKSGMTLTVESKWFCETSDFSDVRKKIKLPLKRDPQEDPPFPDGGYTILKISIPRAEAVQRKKDTLVIRVPKKSLSGSGPETVEYEMTVWIFNQQIPKSWDCVMEEFNENPLMGFLGRASKEMGDKELADFEAEIIGSNPEAEEKKVPTEESRMRDLVEGMEGINLVNPGQRAVSEWEQFTMPFMDEPYGAQAPVDRGIEDEIDALLMLVGGRQPPRPPPSFEPKYPEGDGPLSIAPISLGSRTEFVFHSDTYKNPNTGGIVKKYAGLDNLLPWLMSKPKIGRNKVGSIWGDAALSTCMFPYMPAGAEAGQDARLAVIVLTPQPPLIPAQGGPASYKKLFTVERSVNQIVRRMNVHLNLTRDDKTPSIIDTGGEWRTLEGGVRMVLADHMHPDIYITVVALTPAGPINNLTIMEESFYLAFLTALYGCSGSVIASGVPGQVPGAISPVGDFSAKFKTARAFSRTCETLVMFPGGNYPQQGANLVALLQHNLDILQNGYVGLPEVLYADTFLESMALSMSVLARKGSKESAVETVVQEGASYTSVRAQFNKALLNMSQIDPEFARTIAGQAQSALVASSEKNKEKLAKLYTSLNQKLAAEKKKAANMAKNPPPPDVVALTYDPSELRHVAREMETRSPGHMAKLAQVVLRYRQGSNTEGDRAFIESLEKFRDRNKGPKAKKTTQKEKERKQNARERQTAVFASLFGDQPP